jgi:hypothetical protein
MYKVFIFNGIYHSDVKDLEVLLNDGWEITHATAQHRQSEKYSGSIVYILKKDK